ncbi:hypothetical protein [Bradyrhizobium genosp. P]|uniref:hypothetical protein n=1 Tax=Bradyrhizobium genosp. P TaxID=83641 RepID=UPI003CF2D3E4
MKDIVEKDRWQAFIRFAENGCVSDREIERDYDPWAATRPTKPKRSRKRRMTIARTMRQASEAGVAVGSATMHADGSVTLMFGAPSPAEKSEKINPWDKVLKRAPSKVTLVKR